MPQLTTAIIALTTVLTLSCRSRNPDSQSKDIVLKGPDEQVFYLYKEFIPETRDDLIHIYRCAKGAMIKEFKDLEEGCPEVPGESNDRVLLLADFIAEMKVAYKDLKKTDYTANDRTELESLYDQIVDKNGFTVLKVDEDQTKWKFELVKSVFAVANPSGFINDCITRDMLAPQKKPILKELLLATKEQDCIKAYVKLKNLTSLSLVIARITDISPLKELENLTYLSLYFNEITDISALKDLKNLTELHLDNNQITDISTLKYLKNLTDLRLSYNQITDISTLKYLKNLTDLRLDNNQITDISTLKYLKNLTELHLDNNQITDISTLKYLKNLTDLRLSYNQITDLSALKDLKSLRYLDIRNNKITDFSPLNELKSTTIDK